MDTKGMPKEGAKDMIFLISRNTSSDTQEKERHVIPLRDSNRTLPKKGMQLIFLSGPIFRVPQFFSGYLPFLIDFSELTLLW